MSRSSSLETLIQRQIRLSVVVPIAILFFTTLGLVLRHALYEAGDEARGNAIRASVAIDQSTFALETHWRTALQAAAKDRNLDRFLRALESFDSSVCLVSVWQADTLLFSHPRRDESRRPSRSKSRWSGAERDPRCDETVVRYTLPLDSLRLVSVSFRLSRLSKVLLDPHNGVDNNLSLVDDRGNYVANFKPEFLEQGEVDPLSANLGPGNPREAGYRFEAGRLVGYSTQRLQGPPWTLVARQDVLQTIRSLFPLLGLMVFLLGLSIVVGSRLRAYAVARILAPLENLRRSLDDLEVGRFEKRLAPSGMTEIDNLSDAFNRMAGSIEAREASRRKELERAIDGLESFSYTVSHDLRSPLRAIDGYTRFLVEDEAARLSEEGRRNLDRITAAAHRMHLLIEDLLRLARTKRCSLRLEEFDMDALAREVAAEEGGRVPGRDVRWDIAPLGDAIGDPGLIRQVWSNLFSNALKYSAPRATTIVRVRRTESPIAIEWTVSDNGVGFDQDHATNLFGTFQRLHPDKEFEGTGIGLALVRSIVELHGGNVDADAVPDQGATFRFRLPRSAGDRTV